LAQRDGFRFKKQVKCQSGKTDRFGKNGWLALVEQSTDCVVRRFLQAGLVVVFLATVQAGGATAPMDGNTTSAAPATSAEAYHQAGDAKIKTNDYTGAVVDFNHWVELEPKNAKAWAARGYAKDHAGDLAGSIADLNQSLVLDPSNAPAYYWRGWAKDDAKDYAGAVADFNHALELDPKHADTWYARGIAKEDAGDVAGAITDFDQSLALDQTRSDIYRQAGIAKLNTNDYAGAVVDFDHWVELDPKSAEAWYLRGTAKMSTHDYTGAMTDLGKSLELDPTNVDAHQMRGGMMLKMGNPTGAQAEFTRSLELPHDAGQAELARKGLALIKSMSAGADASIDVRADFRNATINGQPAKIILDTGAARADLTKAGANRLGVKVGPVASDVTLPAAAANSTTVSAPPPPLFDSVLHHQTTPTDWFGTKVPHGLSEAVKIGLGNQTMTTQIPVGDYPGVYVDGVIGWAEVRDNILVFEPVTRTISGVAELPAETAGWLKLKVREDSGTLVLETPLPDGKTGTIKVDTGDYRGVMLPAARWTEWSATQTGASAVGDVTLGALALTNVPVTEESKSIVMDGYIGRLGLAALARMDLVVDAKGGFAYVRPRLPPAANPSSTSGGGNPTTGGIDLSGDWTVADSVQVDRQNILLSAIDLKLATQDYDGAVTDAVLAHQLYPKKPDTMRFLAGAYLERGLYRLNAKKDPDDAIADFDQLLALDPNVPNILFLLAHLHEQKGDWEDVMADTNAILKIAPDNANAYLERGAAEMQQGKSASALADYNHVLTLQPENLWVLLLLSDLKNKQGDYEGSIVAINQYVAHDSQNSQAYLLRGKSKLRTDDVEGSITDFDRAVELDPQNAETYVYRAMARQIQGNFTGALADYDKYIDLLPNYWAPAYLYRQLLLIQLGRPPEDLTKNIATWTDVWSQTLGRFLTGSLGEAELLAAAAKGKADDVPDQQCDAYYFIAIMHLSKGDQAGARENFQKSLATGVQAEFEYKFAQAELARLDKAAAK